MTDLQWQIIAFFGPLAATLLLWLIGQASGQKTNLNVGPFGALAAMEGLDVSFLPEFVTAPLAAGFAAAGIMANNFLTSRK